MQCRATYNTRALYPGAQRVRTRTMQHAHVMQGTKGRGRSGEQLGILRVLLDVEVPACPASRSAPVHVRTRARARVWPTLTC